MTDTPERIGHYRIIRRLGRGGIGEVFLAMRDGSSTPVALKRLLPEMHAHQTALSRLKREAHLVSMIDHPNVARVLDAGLEEGAFCVATELVAGKDLEAFIKDKIAIPIDMAVTVAISILDALAVVHELTDPEGRPVHLVHRDLAPKNVMIGFSGEVKVIDFGIARAQVDEMRTTAGTIIGTPSHLSPEQAAGDPVDARSDLYTVCVLLHEMLTGERMVRGRTAVEMVMLVLSQPARDPSEVAPRVPAALGKVVLRGLEKAPERRWQSARELREALAAAHANKRWSNGELGAFVRSSFPEDHTESERLTPVIEPMPELTRTATRPTLDAAPPRRSIRAWLAGGLAAIALAFIAIVGIAERPAPASIAPNPREETPAPKKPIVSPLVTPRATERHAPEEERASDPPPAAPARLRAPVKRPEPRAPPEPKARDQLTPLFQRVKTSAERGALALDLVDVLLAAMEREASSRETKNAVQRARLCAKTCQTDTAKVRALESALRAIRASAPVR